MQNPSWIALGLTLAAAAGVASVVSSREEKAPASAEAVAADDVAASFEVVDPDKAEVQLDASGAGKLRLLIKNGAGERPVTFALLLSKGSATLTPATPKLPEASVTLQELQVTGAEGCPCRGAVVVQSGSPKALPLQVPLTLTPAPGTFDPSALAVWVSALFAVVLGLVGLAILWEKLGDAADTPRWEPDKSWLTNLAVVGAVFNGLFTLTALTDELGSIGPGELLVTTALFAALAALAPAIFDLGAASSPGGGSGGSLGWFLGAVVFTLWAAAGQLALTAALLEDAHTAGLLAPVVCRLLQTVIAVLVLFVGWYAVWSLLGLKGTAEAAATRESRAATGLRLL
jgi:hypothetical protein